MKKGRIKGCFSGPRFLRAAPLLLSLTIILVSVLAIVTLDQIERKRALRVDFSFNSVTTGSEQSERVLKSLPFPVHAYAIFTPGQEDQALLGLLNRFAAVSANFTYSVDNLVRNPLLVNMLSSELGDEAVKTDSLVIRCEKTGRTRVLDPLDFLEQRYDTDQQAVLLSGLRYEAAVVEALAYVTMDSVPGIRILQGHGELGEMETSVMESLLSKRHYEISRVNLLHGDTLDPDDDLLLVLSPQKDLDESELDMISRFTQGGGAILITSDYSDPDSLPRFDALYRAMGFLRKPGIVVADGEDNAAYIDSPVFLTPYMEMTEPTAPLIGAGQTRLRLPGSRAFDMTPSEGTTLVDSLLTSGQAYIKDIRRAEATLTMEEGDEKGQFSLALLSDRAHPDGTHSRAMILGNSAILLDSWLHEISYGAEFLLRMADYLSPRESISLDITPRALVRPQMEIGNPWLPNLLIILLPLLAVLPAFPLLYYRKKK